ncbi:MAG: Cna B-type domain-containing protein [Peptostreptococcaceae bacterium]|nr:Cna B-type domain-containing protein [Peptostreptococcaceae bacterium]
MERYKREKKLLSVVMALALFFTTIFQTEVYADPDHVIRSTDGSISSVLDKTDASKKTEGEKTALLDGTNTSPSEKRETKDQDAMLQNVVSADNSKADGTNGAKDPLPNHAEKALELDASAEDGSSMLEGAFPVMRNNGDPQDLLGLKMTHQAHSKTKELLTRRFSGKISLNPSSSGTIKDYVIKIRIPKSYLDPDRTPDVEIGNVGSLDSSKIRKTRSEIEGEDHLLQIDMDQIPDNIHMDMTYSFALTPRITPEHFAVTPRIALYEKIGAEEKLLGEELSNVTFEAKYHPIIDFDKSILSQDIGYDRSYRDATALLPYAGENDGRNLSQDLSRLKEIEFYYSFSTAASNSSNKTVSVDGENVIAHQQSYGDGLKDTRFAEQIRLIEKLTYMGSDGQQYKASFDPARNPGWILQPDGETLHYTVQATGTGSADKIIYTRPVKLKLKFPGAPVVRPENIDQAILLSSEVSAEITPKNYDPALENIQTKTDDIRFRFFADNFSLSGVFQKGNLESYKKQVFVGFTHLKEADTRFKLHISNKSGKDMKKIIIEDHDFDEVFYLRGLKMTRSSEALMTDIEQIKLVYEDGSERILPHDQSSKDALIPLDTKTEQAILGEMQNVQKGIKSWEAAKNDLMDDPVASKLVIEMKDDFVLGKDKTITFDVHMGIRNPFAFMLDQEVRDKHETKDINGEELKRFDKPIDDSLQNTRETTQAYNKATLSFEADGIKDRQKILSDSWVRFSAKKSFIKISKSNSPVGSTDHKVGGKVIYRVNLQVASLRPDTVFQDAYFVDLLPEGLEVESILHNDHVFLGGAKERAEKFKSQFGFSRYDHRREMPPELEIIKNYKGTGRTAVILRAQKDLAVSELLEYSGGLGFAMECRITDQVAIESTNRVYFSSSNMNELFQKVEADAPSKVQNFRSIYDGASDQHTHALVASSAFVVQKSSSISAMKYISLDQTHWESGVLSTPFDSPFYYKIKLFNNADKVKDVVIYDVLPIIEDKNYDLTKRNSQFSNHLTGKVELLGKAKEHFDIYYSTEASFDAQQAIASADWKDETQIGTDWNEVKSIKIVVKPGKELEKRNYEFILPMRSPQRSDHLYGKVATNNFLIRYQNVTGGLSNSVSNRLPIRAISLQPSAKVRIRVEKKWVGAAQDKAIVHLYESDKKLETIELKAADHWIGHFEKPATDDHGIKKSYTVREEAIEGYDVRIEGNMRSGFVITNTQRSSGGGSGASSTGGSKEQVEKVPSTPKEESRPPAEPKKELPPISESIIPKPPLASSGKDLKDRFGGNGINSEQIGDHLTPLFNQLEKRKHNEEKNMVIHNAPKTSARGLSFFIPTITAVETEHWKLDDEEADQE